MLPDLLCRFALNAHILTKYGEPPDGRVFEAALVEIARFIGVPTVQGPGRVSLFGTPAASKLRHELDLAMIAPGMLGIAEAKDRSDGVGKNDVMVFLQKSFDYYLSRIAQASQSSTWRFLVSATPVDPDLCVYCIQQGVIVVDPTFIPIPSLLRFVGQPEAEYVFSDIELAEAVRLFEPACLPLEGVFARQAKGLHLDLERFFGREANDAHWLAGQMTTDILEYINQSGGDRFWERAKVLASSGFRALHQSLVTTNAAR